jgi:ADP-heptose:LPS heptosyltransferase
MDVQSSALGELHARVSGHFALLNPGAGWPNKRWPPRAFGELAAFIRDACGLTPVVLWGPGEEALAGEVVAMSSGSAIVAPRTTVTDIVALAREAALVVSGDTGPLHIATAVGTPTVSLFGPTDPERNGPFDPRDIAVSRYDSCGCHYDRTCHQDPWCLAGVTVAEVCAAVKRRLANG